MPEQAPRRARLLAALALGACTPDPGESPPTSASATTSATTAPTSSPSSLDTTAPSSTTTSSTTDPTTADSSTGPFEPPPPCPFDRTELDLPDDAPEPQVRVLYVLPSDGADEQLDTNDTICNSVLAWSQWLSSQTEGRTLRLDTSAGTLDIGFVRLDLPNAVMHGTSEAFDVDTGFAYVRDRIERELVQMGLLVPHKLYAVYYGGTSQYACGGGAYPPVLIGQVGALYLGGEIPGSSPCGEAPWGQADLVPRYLEYAMLHELVHSLGMVDLLAPHEHSSGHAFDDGEPNPERDLMYAPRPGMKDPPWGVYAPGGLVLDLGRDDYFELPDRSLVDLSRSAFLEPLPADPELPPGW
ncbi:hypothetical protein [Paraliomyxa miuraensis]|uniref:hypothetical protein n=1 Tax=Paraliomyxa miuraensis TaxID=376150 RepID=UPI00224D7A37|nr:hypothetical protein [Paraliomyxa miuraensis]MCX4246474.1 hypothetical protein [Paraliomyxa miuraensis]